MDQKAFIPGNYGTKFLIKGTEQVILCTSSKEIVYPLTQLDEREILIRRIRALPTFVLKSEDSFYVANISENDNFNYNIDQPEHKCINCRYCRALPRELGGCEKVRDCSAETYINEGNSLLDAYELSKRIEKYPFIKYGYETFGVKLEVLGIGTCKNYKGISGNLRMNKNEVLSMKFSLEKYYE